MLHLQKLIYIINDASIFKNVKYFLSLVFVVIIAKTKIDKKLYIF